MSVDAASFRLAPMSRMILVLTLVLLAIPAFFAAAVAFGNRTLEGPAVLVLAIYAWVWLRFRPTRFVVRRSVIDVVWPLKRRRIPRAGISGVQLIDACELRRRAGFAMRVGAGGLWGGFGWLWSRRLGIVQMYVSRTDGLVWIERGAERPWLITPEEPDAFVRLLSS